MWWSLTRVIFSQSLIDTSEYSCCHVTSREVLNKHYKIIWEILFVWFTIKVYVDRRRDVSFAINMFWENKRLHICDPHNPRISETQCLKKASLIVWHQLFPFHKEIHIYQPSVSLSHTHLQRKNKWKKGDTTKDFSSVVHLDTSKIASHKIYSRC